MLGLSVAGLALGSGLIWWSRRGASSEGVHTPDPKQGRSSWIPGDALPVLAGAKLLERSEYARLVQSILHKTGLSTQNNTLDVEPVLAGYAQFVQLLPASEAHHHAQPGGLLQHTLEVVDYALSYRRAYMLPLGAGAERVNELKHVWTCGVLFAALFHDLGKPMSDVQVTLYGPKLPRQGKVWHAIAGDMLGQGATHYIVSFKSDRRYEDHQGLPMLLIQRLVSERVMAWLSGQDETLVNQLLKTLSHGSGDAPGVLDELVKRADMESTRVNLLSGPRTRFKTAKEVPLVDILDEALCRLIQSARLRFNVPGGHGFVWAGPEGQGDLLLVCPRIVDELRKFLQEGLVAGSRGIPTDNLIVYSTWMDFARIRPLAGGASNDSGKVSTPRAVWRVQVEGIPTALTVLRFPRESLSWKLLGDLFPDAFAGEIEVVATEVSSQTEQLEQGLDTQTAPQHSQSWSAPAVDDVLPHGEPTHSPPPHAGEVQMPDFLREDYGQEPAAPISVAQMHVQQAQALDQMGLAQGALVMPDETAPMAARGTTGAVSQGPANEHTSLASRLMLMSGPAPTTARAAMKTTTSRATTMKIKEKSKSELLEQFEDWLRLGLKSGHLQYNGAKAMVHFFKELDAQGQPVADAPTVALFVTPALYQRYVKELQPDKWAGVSNLAEIARPAWLPIQTALLKAHAHRAEQQGKINRSIFRYTTKGGGMFNANVLTQPETIFEVVPEPNPYIAGEMKHVALTQAMQSSGSADQ